MLNITLNDDTRKLLEDFLHFARTANGVLAGFLEKVQAWARENPDEWRAMIETAKQFAPPPDDPNLWMDL